MTQCHTPIADIIENFSLLDEWDDRYRYVIELGRKLPPFPEADRVDANKVQGCASQVWLATTVTHGDGRSSLIFAGDSDAHIVRGLVAILIALLSGRPAAEIVDEDPLALFARLGLGEHLTPQRSNGFRSMVARMRADASAVLAKAV
ncbi:SufE family protein [Bradyrhizobium sp. SRS-191]|uniref:SufE family protein n=1 Tax=Bradyrhizobium sp. SRS-191 TaxID=2962606 RepID=UPI00211E86D9|nr:SufE family protein [Bradyrhizobium sp. SRS-191]